MDMLIVKTIHDHASIADPQDKQIPLYIEGCFKLLSASIENVGPVMGVVGYILLEITL